MITLKELAYLYIDDVTANKESVDTHIDVRTVAIRIRQILNELLKAEYYDKYKIDDRSPVPMAIATYTGIDIKYDEVEEVYYSALPDFYINLPYGKGVHSVVVTSSNRKQKTPLIRRNTPDVSYNTMVYDLIREKSYYVEGLRIVYDNRQFRNSKAIVKLIVMAPDSVGLDDPLPVLPEHQAEVLRRLHQYPIFPEDPINDNINAPNTRANS